MKSLRIGVVVDQLLAGGVQFSAIEQVKELNRQGHAATLLILMRKKYPTNFSYLVKKIPHIFVSDSYPRLFQRTLKFPFFSFLSTLHLISPLLAPSVITKRNYDVLISWGTTTCLTTQAIFKKNKLPYIAIIHDPIVYILNKVYQDSSLSYLFWLLRPLARSVEHSFIRDAQATVLISQVHKKYIEETYHIQPYIIPLAVNTVRKRIKIGDHLLSFGRWQKDKHPEMLLTILKSIPNVNLTIAGSWISQKELSDFKRVVHASPLAQRIQIISHYTNDKLLQIASSARMFIHPHFEAFGLAALEAASMGLPIIIPGKSGVTEKFRHGVHGFFPSTPAGFTPYVKTLLQSKTRAARMGMRAQNIVRTEFSWKKHVKQLLQLLPKEEKSKINVAVLELGHVLGNTLSGGDKLLEPMAQRLKKKYTFSVIVSSLGALHWQKNEAVVKITILPTTFFDYNSNPVTILCSYIVRMIYAIEALRKSSAEYVYSSTNIFPDVLPAALCKKADQIWIARVHHLIPPPSKRAGNMIVNIGAYLLQIISITLIKSRADIVIALNEPLKTQLSRYGIAPEKLRVLGGGIELKKFKQLRKQKSTFDAIYVGRIHHTKGVFDLVPIWREVIRQVPHARLAIIGTGSKIIEQELRARILKSDIDHSIKILGYVPEYKLLNYLKKSRVFLFTDHEAGWGLAAAEAMAAGVPVIGYDIGVLGQVFKKGYKSVPLGDTSQFAQIIVNMITHKKLHAKLAIRAQNEASRFDWKITTQRFQKIIVQT